jgi:hypothetical protein
MKTPMKNKLKLALAALLIASANLASAQIDTTLVQSASFVGDLNIFLKDANKINVQPFVIENTDMGWTSLKYAMLPTRQVPFTQPATIGSSAFPMEKKLKKLQRGFIDIGMGTYVTPKVDFYFTEGRSKKGDWGVHYHHQSANSSTTVNDRVPISTTYSDNAATLWGKRFYKNFQGEGSVNWTRNVSRWYGVDPLFVDSVTTVGMKQRMNAYQAKVGFRSYERDSAEVNWWGQANYRLAQDAWKGNENFVDVQGGLSKLVKSEVFSADLGLTYNSFNAFGYNWSNDVVNKFEPNDTTKAMRNYDNAVIRFVPTAYTVWKDLRVKIGMGMYLQSRGAQRGYFYPQGEISYSILKGIIVPYVGVKGSLAQQTYYGLYQQNPFVVTQPQLINTNNKIQAYGGINGSISRRVNYMTGVEYNRTENFAFFQRDSLFSFGNMQNVIYGDLTEMKIKGEVEVLGGKTWDAKLGGSYSYFVSTEDHAWNLPNLKIYGVGKYRLNDQWNFQLQAYYIGERWAKSVSPMMNVVKNEQGFYEYKMKAFIDANIKVSYEYNERLSAYVQVNNILSQKYYLYSGFQSQHILAFLGAAYSF